MNRSGKPASAILLHYIAIAIVFQLGAVPGLIGQEPVPSGTEAWTGSAEQKLWGLMTVWAETRYAFPHFDKRPGLDWDATVQQYIPRVLSAEDMDDYYHLLLELVALLEDSHTSIIPPWGYFKPGFDLPPVEIAVVEGRFLITRTGDSDEIDAQRIYPGLEIVAVGDGRPIRTHFDEHVLKYHTRGSAQGNEAILPIYLLYGPAGETIALKVSDMDGNERNVILTRNSAGRDGAPFMYGFVEKMFLPTIRSRMLEDGVQYVSVPNFENPQVQADFIALIDGLDTNGVTGLVIDLRSNLGGSSSVCNGMVACLIDKPVSSPLMNYRQYAAAEIAWGREPKWSTVHNEIAPREGKRYLGPLVLLTDGGTNSTAEDFVIELQQTGRALVVGRQTCGGAGNALASPLPGGGTFQVSTFAATFPDGREFAGIGIQPDVEIGPTREGVHQGRDVVLEKAIEVIRDWEAYVSR